MRFPFWLLMSVLVTVGSTGFDLLVQAVISNAFLDAIHSKGFTHLTVQCGNSTVGPEAAMNDANYHSFHSQGIGIELWKYKPSIRAEMQKSDIIISHAGTRASQRL
jgi:beta-1,4-N-acetylglucosaminyltransferase